MVGFGANKQVLIVGNDGVQLYVVKGKKVALHHDYSDAGGNLSSELEKSFRALNLPLIILFDVVEQQYRKETMPKVGFLDKTKVVKRKLQMAFPQQQMRAYLPLKQKPRENEGMIALFAGLAPNLTITQIMDAVISSEVSLDGAGLLPLESANLVLELTTALHKRDKTTGNTRWSVLMTHHKTGGLRQIVVKDSELALTRITPLAVNPDNAESLTEEMIREFNATLTYLSRFGYIPSDGLDLIIISSPDICKKFAGYQLPVTNLYALSLEEAGRMLKIQPMLRDHGEVFGEIVHAGWNGVQSRLKVPLAAPRMDKVRNARQMARLASLAMFLGLGYMGWQVATTYMDMNTLKNDISEQKTRLVALQHEHDELSKKLLTFDNDPEMTRNSLAVYDMFAKNHIDFEPTLKALIPLVPRDKITLRSFSMVPVIEDDGLIGTIADIVMPVEGGVPAETKPRVVMRMEIGFMPDTATEDAARLTNEFVERLKGRFPGRDITVSEMVGNLSADKTVQGVSQQIADGVIDGELVENGTSSVTFTGAIE